MRIIDNDAPEPVWVDLPNGGRLQFRVPTWEDKDRATNRVAMRTEGDFSPTDVTRELLQDLMVGQEEFGRKGTNGSPIPAVLPDDAPAIVASLDLIDVRAIEKEALYPVHEAEGDLGN